LISFTFSLHLKILASLFLGDKKALDILREAVVQDAETLQNVKLAI